MPRVIPRRAPFVDRSLPIRGPEPTPLPNDLDRSLRVTETFKCEGILFEKGYLVTPDSELVQKILAEAPHLLKPANQ